MDPPHKIALLPIDICLEARAKAVIELAATVSLFEAADKAEKVQRQMKEVEKKYYLCDRQPTQANS
ncbi:MAG: hypothetical protein PUP93_31445 [Rhizonema sp. NSF051]|nr:hypothetical protein [Rhizonema sp. NSF051]